MKCRFARHDCTGVCTFKKGRLRWICKKPSEVWVEIRGEDDVSVLQDEKDQEAAVGHLMVLSPDGRVRGGHAAGFS